jgi:hypothetical protein
MHLWCLWVGQFCWCMCSIHSCHTMHIVVCFFLREEINTASGNKTFCCLRSCAACFVLIKGQPVDAHVAYVRPQRGHHGYCVLLTVTSNTSGCVPYLSAWQLQSSMCNGAGLC